MLTRRKLLSATPALVLTAPVAAVAGIEGESELMRLFREWDALYQLNGLASPHLSDKELDAFVDFNCKQQSVIERKMAKIPARDAREFSAKLVAFTSYAEFALDTRREMMIAEAQRFLGGATS